MRMHLWIGAATVAIPLCFADESLAGTQENSMVLGVGTLPCSQWTAHGRTAPDAYIMKSWVLGYVSAYNFLYWPTGDITSETNEAGIVISLNNLLRRSPIGHYRDRNDIAVGRFRGAEPADRKNPLSKSQNIRRCRICKSVSLWLWHPAVP